MIFYQLVKFNRILVQAKHVVPDQTSPCVASNKVCTTCPQKLPQNLNTLKYDNFSENPK